MNSPAIVALLAKLTAREVSDGVAEGDRKVLVTVAPAQATDATKAQHARFARAVQTLYKLDCDGAFAPRSTGRSNASGLTPSAPHSAGLQNKEVIKGKDSRKPSRRRGCLQTRTSSTSPPGWSLVHWEPRIHTLTLLLHSQAVV